MRFIILFLLLSVGLFGQGIEPTSFQPTPYKGGVFIGVIENVDEFTGDTNYIYQHSDTTFASIDSLVFTDSLRLYTNKGIFSTYISVGSYDSIYVVSGVTKDTIRLRDGSGFALVDRATIDSTVVVGGAGITVVESPANRFTVTGTGGTVKGSGVPTRVAWWGGADSLSSNANLFWDNVNGRLGVGTASPLSQLSVFSNTTDARRGIGVFQYINSPAGSVINFVKSRGTAEMPITITSGDYAGSFTFQNYDGIDYRINANFGFRSTGSISTNNIPGQLYFATSNTNDNNPYTNNTVRMVIGTNVGVNTIYPLAKFHVNDAVVDGTPIRVGYDDVELGYYLGLGYNRVVSTLGGTAPFKVGTSTLNQLRLMTNNTDAITIDNFQNIGIGTTSPTRKLDVNGELRIRDLTTTAATKIVSVDNDGVLSSLGLNGLVITGGNLTVTATTSDSTNVVGGAGISVLESPANTFTVTNTGDLSTTNELQNLFFATESLGYTWLDLSGGSGVYFQEGTGINLVRSSSNVLQVNSTVTNTDNQTLSWSSPNLSISGGNSVALPVLPTATTDQTLRYDGTNWVVTSMLKTNTNRVDINSWAGTVNLGSKLLVNGFIQYNNAGTSATTLTGRDTDGGLTGVTIGSGLSLSGGTLSNTSLNTDAQTLSYSSGTLSISGGNSVSIPTGSGTVTSVTATSPIIITSTPTTTPNVTIQNASTSTTGALTSTDWNTFNNKVGGSGTATRVAFWNNSNSISSNPNFYWDNTNNRLGVNTIYPLAKFHVNDAVVDGTPIRVGYDDVELGYYLGLGYNRVVSTLGGTAPFKVGTSTLNQLRLMTNNTDAITINNFQNIGIGTTTPSYKLDVTGDIRMTNRAGTGVALAGFDANGKLIEMYNGTGLSLSGNVLSNTVTGTVTSIATTNGITGGTITSTGTVQLTGQASALHNLGTNGLIARTGSGTVAARSLVGGGGITITNADGVAGNPVITANRAYGMLGAGTKYTTTSEAKIEFGFEGPSYNGVSSAPNDRITIYNSGVFLVTFHCTIHANTSSSTIRAQLFQNGFGDVDADIQSHVKVGEPQNMSFSVVVSGSTPYFEVKVSANNSDGYLTGAVLTVSQL